MIYLASPIDHANKDVLNCRASAVTALTGEGFAVFDPSRAYHGALKDPIAVHGMNQLALELCDGVFAILIGRTVGVPMEILIAHQLGKPLVVISDRDSLQTEAMGIATYGPELDDRTTKSAVYELERQLDEDAIKELVSGPATNGNQTVLWQGLDAHEPVRKYAGDAGFDLICAEDTQILGDGFVDISCGVKLQMPPNVWGLITGRSSTLRKRNLLVSQGVIDNGYRGPIFAGVKNLGPELVWIKKGERLAQLIFFDLVAPRVNWQKATVLEPSDRGESGFGSTG